ncbi:MAG: response regulator transcription factor [Spirochaetota bacterium]
MASRKTGRKRAPLLVYLLRSSTSPLDYSVDASGSRNSVPDTASSLPGCLVWRLIVGDIWPPPPQSVLAVIPVEAIPTILEGPSPASSRLGPCIAYGTASQLTAAFSAGALDYLRVPWEAEELVGRVERVLRASGPGALLPPDLLSPGEARVLRGLILAGGDGAPRDALAYLAYGERAPSSGRRLDMFVSRLRRKLRSLPDGPGIRAIRGWGFRLEPGPGAPLVDNLWAKSSDDGLATHYLSDPGLFEKE